MPRPANSVTSVLLLSDLKLAGLAVTRPTKDATPVCENVGRHAGIALHYLL